MEECALALEVLADVPHPVPRLAGLRIGVLDPIARHGASRGVRGGLRGDGAAALGARAADLRRGVRLSSTAISMQSAATNTPPTSSASWLRASSCPPLRIALSGRRSMRGACAASASCTTTCSSRRRCRASCRWSRKRRRPTYRARVTANVRPFNWLGWPSATTRDGVLFSGRSDATVLAAALAWERELPPPTTA